jgi:poly-beta-1,6-N-acetyl-D-glucosamine synthase
VPIQAGGIDLVAVITARMKGWDTRTFTEKRYEHHRRTQGGKHFGLGARFRSGYHDYLMGVHPVWQLFRCIYQMGRPPLFVGGSLLLIGYVWALLTKAERPVSRELIAFRRNEEMRRLRTFFTGSFTSSGESTPRS